MRNNNPPQKVRHAPSLNDSSQALKIRRQQSLNANLNEIQYQKLEQKRIKRQNLSHLYSLDYKPANYKKAVDYANQRSYKKKIGENSYKQIGLFENTDQLKAFGLGPYFLVEFMRRAVWLFFILSLLEALRIYINVKGDALGNYSISFSTFLIMTTIGNFGADVLTGYDIWIMTIIPCVTIIAYGLWFLIWKRHYYAVIAQSQESNQTVMPEKFAVQVNMEERLCQEQELERFFSVFGPVYEVSLVRQFSNKLSYFEELEQLDQEIKQEQLEIILGSGDQENLRGLKKERDQLNKYISTLRIKPRTLSAYIHYQYEKSKVDMEAFYNDNYLYDTCGNHCCRGVCCCCMNDIDQKHKFKGKALLLNGDKVPSPQDINWDSRQISTCSKFCRIMFGILVIIIFIALSCTIIGLCSVYISGHSIDCTDTIIPDTVTQAEQANQTDFEKRCFCNANLIASFTDTEVVTYCGDLITQLYTEQGIQWAVVITSGFTNFLFGLIVSWMINLTRPQSNSFALNAKTRVYTLFMIFNSCLLPMLIYADIFGFRTAEYLSFVTLVSTDLRAFLQVESISFQTDFNNIWYRNVSPIFANYIIVETGITWLFLIIFKCLSNRLKNVQDDQGRILQKHMNSRITSYKFNVYVEYSYFLLILTMGTFFAAGCPSVVPLTFICLFSKYIFTRSLIQNNSSRIQGLSESLQGFTFALIPILLVVSALFGSWMLTANDYIYPDNFHAKIDFGLDFDILNRQLYLPWFLITALVIAAYFLFYNTIVRFCSWLGSLCYEKKQVVHPYHALPFSEYARKLNVLSSYNIRNNDKYKNVIINLEKYMAMEKE